MKFSRISNRRPVAFFMIVVLGMFMLSCGSAYKDYPPSSLDKEGYILDFQDEFNEAELDTTVWLTKYFPHATTADSKGVNATYRLKRGKLELYIDKDAEPYTPNDTVVYFVGNGIQTFEKNLLHPGAGRKNVTSVEPFDGYATKYGYFEMRAKLPDCGDGSHFAWWMVGCQDDADENGENSTQNAEIDIVEAPLNNVRNSKPCVHGWDDKTIVPYRIDIQNEGNPDKEYHLYGMDWSPEGIKFYYDNELIGETSSSPSYRMCMFLTIYTNKLKELSPAISWTGLNKGIYPKTVYIDYIRVWKRESGY